MKPDSINPESNRSNREGEKTEETMPSLTDKELETVVGGHTIKNRTKNGEYLGSLLG